MSTTIGRGTDEMLTTLDDFRIYQGGSGQYRPSAISTALALAENKVAQWLNTPLVPTTIIEEQPWPENGKLQLDKVRTISITSVQGLYGPQCDCTRDEVDGCSSILNAKFSQILVLNCNGGGCAGGCWTNYRYPTRVQVTYIAGLTSAQSNAGTDDGDILRASIFTAALGFLQSTIGLDAPGNLAINNYSSAGYSEGRNFNERSGAEEMIHPLIQQAREMIRGSSLNVKRVPPSMRG